MIDPFADDIEMQMCTYPCAWCKRERVVEFAVRPKAPEGWKPVWRKAKGKKLAAFSFRQVWICGREECQEKERELDLIRYAKPETPKPDTSSSAGPTEPQAERSDPEDGATSSQWTGSLF